MEGERMTATAPAREPMRLRDYITAGVCLALIAVFLWGSTRMLNAQAGADSRRHETSTAQGDDQW